MTETAVGEFVIDKKEIRQEKAPSVRIAIPYTSRVAYVGKEEDKIPEDATANIVLSSFSAMVAEAIRMDMENGPPSQVIVLGENTFGPDHKSTADLIKERLAWRKLPEDTITALGNLQDTDQQLEALVPFMEQHPEVMRNPVYFCMEFHKKRIEKGLAKNHLPGKVKTVEDILRENFERNHTRLKERDPEKYEEKYKRYDKILKNLTPNKIRIVENFINILLKLGPIGKAGMNALRDLRGGATVTHISVLKSAAGHLEEAKEHIRKGNLKPTETPREGITKKEAFSI